MTQHAPHGTLQPGLVSIRCDGKGCTQQFGSSYTSGGLDEIQARQYVRALAEQNGWYVTLDRGVDEDLCPGCAPRGRR